MFGSGSFGGRRRSGEDPFDLTGSMSNDPFANDPFFGNLGAADSMLDRMFNGPFGGGFFGGARPFFSDPFFSEPFSGVPSISQQPQPSQRGGRQGATIEELQGPHADEGLPSSHQPLVEEPDDTDMRRRRSPRGGGEELMPRSRSDLFEGCLGGGGGFGGGFSSSSSTSYSSHGGPGGGGYSKTVTSRRGPDGVEEREEVVRDSNGKEWSVTHSRRIGDKGRTTVRSRDAEGREASRDMLHGLTEADAATFDAEWGRRGGGGGGRCEDGGGGGGSRFKWLRLPGFSDGDSGRNSGSGGGGNPSGSGGGRRIDIV